MLNFIDCVSLEMRMADIMSQQEASGFRFDVNAAERVRAELQQETADLESFYCCSLCLCTRQGLYT